MTNTMVLVDRDALLVELQTVFDAQTADTLLRVLDKVAAQVHAAGINREDFSELKQIIAGLATEVQRLAVEVQKLVETQQRHEEQLSRLGSDVKELKTDVKELKTDVKELKTDVKEQKTDVGKLKGRALESTYRDKAPAYFGPLLRRPKVVDVNSLWDDLDAHLSREELDDVLLVDLLVQGKPRHQPEIGEIYLVVEVSSVVDLNDVKRAQQRAKLLQRAGYRVIPVVAGEKMTSGAEEEAHTQKVAILQDGRRCLWEEALASWTKP